MCFIANNAGWLDSGSRNKGSESTFSVELESWAEEEHPVSCLGNEIPAFSFPVGLLEYFFFPLLYKPYEEAEANA